MFAIKTETFSENHPTSILSPDIFQFRPKPAIQNHSFSFDTSPKEPDIILSGFGTTIENRTVLEFLKDKEKQIECLQIDDELHGIIDFSILIRQGFHHVKKIILGEGKITELLHLPSSLIELECTQNLLSSLKNLPLHLESINVSQNMILEVDVQYLEKVKKINVSENPMKTLKIPNTLVYLNIKKTDIKILDCSTFEHLREIEYSKETILLNVHEHTKHNSEIDIKTDENEIDFHKALDYYFTLKKNYKKSKQPQKCIRCLRKGGTVFTKVKNIYTARCGSIKKCFEIVLDTNIHKNDTLVHSFMENKRKYETTKDTFIKQKLDTIFQYTSEEESKKLFQQNIVEFANTDIAYVKMEAEYRRIFCNQDREQSIIQIKRTIRDDEEFYQQYIDNGGIDVIEKTLMQIELGHKYKTMRRVLYDTTFMEHRFRGPKLDETTSETKRIRSSLENIMENCSILRQDFYEFEKTLCPHQPIIKKYTFTVL